MRIVALGDVHANAPALAAALGAARASSPDLLVILGDLLTYGPDVGATLDLVEAAVAGGAVLIRGNHDELYLDLLRGERAYYDGLPPWIRESVDWTLAALDPDRLRALPFVDEHVAGEVLLTHANPFGDWRYLQAAADLLEAGRLLRDRGVRAGVFGHTHRARLVELPSLRGADEERSELTWRPEGPEDALALNAGSVGQPRSRVPRSTCLRIDVGPDRWDLRVLELDVDPTAHVAALAALPLSEDARARLIRFHRAQAS